MEKYSQFRDRGTGIAPFLPVPTTPSGVYLPLHILLFLFRLPVLLFVTIAYFFIFCWLPIGSLGKKAALWLILGVPGIWWVDLQVDGVKRGSLTKRTSLLRLPQPGSIIVSSFTSPIDALYIAAIFDPVFTVSYPNSRLLHHTTLFHSIVRAFFPPVLSPAPNSRDLTTLAALTKKHPKRIICVLPECTTTNGRGILPLSPSLLSAPPRTRIFPTSLRYTPPDITTPVPGWKEAGRFVWNLCSKPTHTIRVRVAEAVFNTSLPGSEGEGMRLQREGSIPGTLDYDELSDADGFEMSTMSSSGEVGMLDEEEKRVLDRIGEALARLGRVKRVGVGVREKIEFVRVWGRRR